MKSPGFSKQLSLLKVCAVLLSILFMVVIGSCTQESQQVAQLPSDQEITDTIQAQLDAAKQIPADSINIDTKDGIVTLSGSTSNLLAKRETNKIAQSTYGVLSVVNNLKVTVSRPDDALDRDVDRALATDPAIETMDVTSQVNNGVVTLEGRVESWQERQLAAAVTSSVKGVKEIENNILVNYSQARSDDDVQTEIEQKLKMSSQVNANMVNVSVANGEVTLTGSIGSAYEKKLVQDLARVAGVTTVAVDELEVHPEYDSRMYRNEEIASLTNRQIKQAMTSAFRYDPRVPADSISVSMNGNTAILEGSVLYLNSKRAAESDAMNTAGVNNVQNNITVQRKVVVEPEVPTTDDAITQRLSYAIQRDPYVDKTAVTVEVNSGVATISGEVGSQFQKEQLDQIASNVKGIIAVNNNVTVTAATNT